MGSGGASATAISSGINPNARELYLVASFNDWMPMRMKTLRDLRLEKYSQEDEDIPNDLFMADHTVALYASMVPPGQHFFYLC